MDVALGNCEWPDPHPPHLWADELGYGALGVMVKVFGCTGTDED